MKYLLTVLVFSITATVANAQVPGYMGKRAWVTADLYFAPALFNMNQNHMNIKEGDPLDIENRSKGTNLLAFNYRPQLKFEYLVGRNIALGLTYTMFRTGTVKELDSTNPDIDGIHYDLIKGSSLGFHVKKFNVDKSASIAPIGYYWTYGVAATKFNTYNPAFPKQGQFSKDVINPVITVGFGKQTVLFDKFILDSGAEFGWSFMPTDASEVDYTQEGDHEHGLSIHHAYRSMMGYYLFNLKVAVGCLAF